MESTDYVAMPDDEHVAGDDLNQQQQQQQQEQQEQQEQQQPAALAATLTVDVAAMTPLPRNVRRERNWNSGAQHRGCAAWLPSCGAAGVALLLFVGVFMGGWQLKLWPLAPWQPTHPADSRGMSVVDTSGQTTFTPGEMIAFRLLNWQAVPKETMSMTMSAATYSQTLQATAITTTVIALTIPFGTPTGVFSFESNGVVCSNVSIVSQPLPAVSVAVTTMQQYLSQFVPNMRNMTLHSGYSQDVQSQLLTWINAAVKQVSDAVQVSSNNPAQVQQMAATLMRNGLTDWNITAVQPSSSQGRRLADCALSGSQYTRLIPNLWPKVGLALVDSGLSCFSGLWVVCLPGVYASVHYGAQLLYAYNCATVRLEEQIQLVAGTADFGTRTLMSEAGFTAIQPATVQCGEEIPMDFAVPTLPVCSGLPSLTSNGLANSVVRIMGEFFSGWTQLVAQVPLFGDMLPNVPTAVQSCGTPQMAPISGVGLSGKFFGTSDCRCLADRTLSCSTDATSPVTCTVAFPLPSDDGGTVLTNVPMTLEGCPKYFRCTAHAYPTARTCEMSSTPCTAAEMEPGHTLCSWDSTLCPTSCLTKCTYSNNFYQYCEGDHPLGCKNGLIVYAGPPCSPNQDCTTSLNNGQQIAYCE